MTLEDIIRMMREACDKDTVDAWHNDYWTITQSELERFAALVAAAKEQEMRESGWRQCAKGQRTTQFCGQLQAAVAAEREECAKVCETEGERIDASWVSCAAAIRARGEK